MESGESIGENDSLKSNYIILLLFVLVMGALSLIPLVLDYLF